uniref:Ovule protein n=1 Tax=Romanomermis culicivorax TaxID=13658 RepID=A0A915JG65_ROMCU
MLHHPIPLLKIHDYVGSSSLGYLLAYQKYRRNLIQRRFMNLNFFQIQCGSTKIDGYHFHIRKHLL